MRKNINKFNYMLFDCLPGGLGDLFFFIYNLKYLFLSKTSNQKRLFGGITPCYNVK